MSIPKRYGDPCHIISNNRTFFVTSSTQNKRQLLQSAQLAKLFIENLYCYRGQNKFRLHEFVVMPDHFHLIITVGSDITIEKAMQFIKGAFTYRANKDHAVYAPFWQKGFSEVRILHAGSYSNFREYIHQNPVKRRLAIMPEEYEFSSARPGFDLDPAPVGLTAERRSA
jgi:putative transposase